MINCYKLLVSDLLKVVDNARVESLRHCFMVRISHYILIAAVEEILIKKGKGSTQRKLQARV